jgi:hypothetical protein
VLNSRMNSLESQTAWIGQFPEHGCAKTGAIIWRPVCLPARIRNSLLTHALEQSGRPVTPDSFRDSRRSTLPLFSIGYAKPFFFVNLAVALVR